MLGRRGRRLEWAPALLRALPLYWLFILPRTRRELGRWDRRAEAIADPVLRRHALAKLASERIVVEGAATFAILAHRRHRADVIRACVAYEVIYDFVDVIGEQYVVDMLAHNRSLHRALLSAVTPCAPFEDHFARFPDGEDGGYLHDLIATCRTALVRLPSYELILPAVAHLSVLAGEAQSLNHAGTGRGHEDLAKWAALQSTQPLSWWELAAAASSPLGVFALFAAASEHQTTPQDVVRIHEAYFPWIDCIVWLMESLVDQRDDAVSGNHNYVARYAGDREAAARLATIAARGMDKTHALPHGARHAILLAGGVSLYLSGHDGDDDSAQAAATAIRSAMGGRVVVLLMVLRAQRRASHLRRAWLQRNAGPQR